MFKINEKNYLLLFPKVTQRDIKCICEVKIQSVNWIL